MPIDLTMPSQEEKQRQIAERKSRDRRTDIFFVAQDGVTELEQRAALEGILGVLRVAGQQGNIRVSTSSSRSDFHRFTRETLARISHDGYINTDEVEKSGRSGIQEKMREERINGVLYTYFMLLKDNIGVYGSASHRSGGIVSVAHLNHFDNRRMFDAIKTLSVHEQGHVYGLIPPERNVGTEESLGKHCTDKCSMRQVYSISDIANVTEDRLNFGLFCRQCTQDLKAYFI